MRQMFAVMMVFVSGGMLLSAEPAVTESNWKNHPSIAEIRQIFLKTEEGIRQKKIKAEKSINRALPSGSTEKIDMYLDANGNVLKCIRAGGTDDSAYTMSHYYDYKHELRFVFVQLGAVNGAAAEYRIYFDDSSKRLWHNREWKSKERYPFTEVWPDDLILFNPWKVTAAD